MIPTKNLAICAYGAEVMQRSLSAFRKEIPGALRSRDIEYVHRLRVASRRLGTALAVFHDCHSTKRMKVWQKDLKQATSTLGKARDLDIQAEGVRSFLKAAPDAEQRPGIRRLLLRVKQKRKRVQLELFEMLKMLNHHQTLISIEVRSSVLGKSTNDFSLSEKEVLTVFAGGTILPELEHFLSYDQYVDKVEAVEELHAMRIAAKKFRYTLECLSTIYPDNLAEYLSIMRVIQDHLGTIHDCDVWQSSSSRLIENERQRTEKYFGSDRAMKRLMPGFLAFFEDRRRQRDESYTAFTVFWHELRQTHLWDKLRSRITPLN